MTAACDHHPRAARAWQHQPDLWLIKHAIENYQQLAFSEPGAVKVGTGFSRARQTAIQSEHAQQLGEHPGWRPAPSVS